MTLYRRLIICFFLSGSTALIYEVAWVRMLAQSYGQTVYAVGVVLTTFMTGLSLGSYFLGKAMDRCKSPLACYAAMEGGIAFFALLSIFFLRKGPVLYIETLSTASPLWAHLLVKYALTILLLLPSTLLMGGTLPVLSKILIRRDTELEGKLGSIYSINTFGAAFGALLAGFVLIHHAGLNATILFGVAINASIAIYVYWLSLKNRGFRDEFTWKLPEQSSHSMPKQSVSILVLLGLMLSGCTAMMYEVAWNRLLVAVIGSTTYSLSLILFGVLLGIGLGSLAISYISKRRSLGLGHFAAIQLSLGATCFLPIVMFTFLPAAMHMGMMASGGNFILLYLFKFLIVLALVLAPMLLLGSSFPIIGAIYRKGFVNRGRDIGSLYALNTAGAIVGTVVASFWLLPILGTTMTIKAAGLLNVLTGVLALWGMGRIRLAIAAMAIMAVPLLPHSIPLHAIDTGVAVYGHTEGFALDYSTQKIMYFNEGVNANVSVTAYSSGPVSLKINGKADASTTSDMPTQLALGYIPMLLHPEPRDTLVIGLGIGVTLRSVAEFSDIERVDCVEIEPSVYEAMEHFFAAHRGVLADPRVTLTIDDARKYMLMTNRQYDVIISEPSNPWISGIGNLFTREFYSTALSKLRRKGIFVQWMQIYGVDPVDLRMIMATMADVFPELSLWQVDAGNLLLIGGRGATDVLDMNTIASRLEAYGSLNGGDLRAYLNIRRPIDLSPYFMMGTGEIREISRGAIIITDNKPEIEFHAPFSMYDNNKLWENLRMLRARQRPPVITGYGTAPETEAELYYLRSRNSMDMNMEDMSGLKKALALDPYNATYLALEGKRLLITGFMENAREALSRALELEPDNAEANFQMGILLRASGGTARQATGHLEKAAALDPDNFRYNVDIGYHYYQLGNYEDAIKYMNRANGLPHSIKESMSLSMEIGNVYLAMGDMEMAEKSYKDPFTINPYYMDAIRNLTKLYLNTRQMPEACEMLEFAIEVAQEKNKGEINDLILQNCSYRNDT